MTAEELTSEMYAKSKLAATATDRNERALAAGDSHDAKVALIRLGIEIDESPQQIAERFGLPLSWAQLHKGRHICVDGRNYSATCLVSDPTCEYLARSSMNRNSTR